MQLLREHRPRDRHAVHEPQVAHVAAVNPIGRSDLRRAQGHRPPGRRRPGARRGRVRGADALRRAAGERDRPLRAGGRRQARAAGAAAAGEPALRLPGRARDRAGVDGRVHPHGLAAARRHHRRGRRRGAGGAASTAAGATTSPSWLGDFLYTKSMAMALSQDNLRDPAPALRRHAAPDRGRDPRDRAQRQHARDRRGAPRHHPAQDRGPLRGLHADRRDPGRRRRGAGAGARAATA